MEGGRYGGREVWREGGMEVGRYGGREVWREGGMEGGRYGGREVGVRMLTTPQNMILPHCGILQYSHLVCGSVV